LVEQSHLRVRRTLANIGIAPTTLYRWYDRFVEQGPEGLEDRSSRPSRVWNCIPDAVRSKIVELALEEPVPSPRELAVRFTDTKKYPRHGLSDQWHSHGSISEASVYRLLKSHDLISSPAYIVIKGGG
jgi:putative transposase